MPVKKTKHPMIIFDPPPSTPEERLRAMGVSKSRYREILKFLAERKAVEARNAVRKKANPSRRSA